MTYDSQARKTISDGSKGGHRRPLLRLSKHGGIALAIIAVVGLAIGLAGVRLQKGQLLSVQTGSMEPAISKGDLAIVLPVKADNIRSGDIVTFTSKHDSPKTVTHRVIAPPGDDGTLQTKGDANAAPDAPISQSTVIGKTQHVIPKLGYATDFIRTPAGLLLCIYVPGLAIIAAEIQRLTRHYRKQQPYVLPGHQLKPSRRKT